MLIIRCHGTCRKLRFHTSLYTGVIDLQKKLRHFLPRKLSYGNSLVIKPFEINHLENKESKFPIQKKIVTINFYFYESNYNVRQPGNCQFSVLFKVSVMWLTQATVNFLFYLELVLCDWPRQLSTFCFI
jgi:hypothetical protein